MCFVYVVQHGAVLGVNGGCLTIKYQDGTVRRIPKNTVEGISIFANAVLTTQCIDYCLKSDVKVGFFSTSGIYRGSLSSSVGANPFRLRRQIQMFDDEDFSLCMARKIISAKVRNQITVMRRYSYGRDDIEECTSPMRRISTIKVPKSKSINQIIGYEGIASRYYFEWISKIINTDFSFEGRVRRPASDPFNCMLSFGYSVLTKELIGELENRNLNSFIGFMHKDKYGHPALASDMLEEWRPVIVDSVVLSLIQGREIDCSEFELSSSGCKMSEKSIKCFINKLEQKMETPNKYLVYFNKPITFREAIWHQADRLSRAVDNKDADLYRPIVIR